MELTPADIDADIDVVDNLDTVTVLQVNPNTGATAATATGVTVLKRGEEKSEQPADEGGVPVVTCRWHLRASTLAFVPKDRDRVVDGDDVWVIRKVTKAAMQTRYVCETAKYPG